MRMPVSRDQGGPVGIRSDQLRRKSSGSPMLQPTRIPRSNDPHRRIATQTSLGAGEPLRRRPYFGPSCAPEGPRVSGPKPHQGVPMATTLNPYLNFDGNTETAMKFYAEALN